MNKTITTLLAFAAATTVATAGSFYWYSEGDLGDGSIGDPDNTHELYVVTGKGAFPGHMVAIFKATEVRTSGTWYQDLVIYDDLSVAAPYAGDTLVYQETLLHDYGWVYFGDGFSDTVTLDDGAYYYTVVFDVPPGGVVAGSQYVILDKTTYLAGGSGDEYLVFEEDQNAGVQWNDILAVPTVNPPVVTLTTADTKVLPATTTYDITGTANGNVVGQISWSNVLNSATGSIPAAAGWTITGVPLAEGPNMISVSGTNATGTASGDAVTITRQEVSTAPWFQGFETDTPTSWAQADTWAILQGAALVAADPGNDATPEFQTVRSHLASWQSVNEAGSTALLELDNVSVAALTGSMTLTAHLSATTLDEEFIGLLDGDSIKFFVALNGAAYSATPDIEIQGKGATSGVLWGYDATGVAATTAGSPLVFQPASEGELPDGYATVQITIPAGTSMVKMKVEAGVNQDTFNCWNIDDISLDKEPISLQITGITTSGGDVHLEWQGGAGATNIVETRQDLADINETWQVLYTAPPSTPAVTNYVHTAPASDELFYRIRAED